MQIIFQDPLASLDPRMTVRQIVEQPLLNFGNAGNAAERRARVADTINLVGGHQRWLDRYPHEFSGGQAQRIGIARALILQPKLLVCDEPVLGARRLGPGADHQPADGSAGAAGPPVHLA